MRATTQICVLAAFFSAAIASPATTHYATDYGYWNVNVTSGSAASGYRYGDVYAEYSKTPGQISHFSWIYSPALRNTTVTTDNPAFNSSIVDGQGSHDIEITQTVEMGGANVSLVGTAQVTMACGLGGNGRGCAAPTINITASTQ